eukprot:1121451-Pleurochrysis_carterae.AAC.4
MFAATPAIRKQREAQLLMVPHQGFIPLSTHTQSHSAALLFPTSSLPLSPFALSLPFVPFFFFLAQERYLALPQPFPFVSLSLCASPAP